MSSTESKTDNVNNINDGETTRTGVEDIEADDGKIACERHDEKQKDDETSSTHSKGEIVNYKDIEREGGKCQCNIHDQNNETKSEVRK